MFTDQQKAKCLLWYKLYEAVAAVRRKFRNCYHVHYHQTSGENSIFRWSEKFKETGSVKNKRRSGRPSVPNADQVCVREAFENTLTLSTRRASLQLDMPHSTVYKIIARISRISRTRSPCSTT
jgi:transposase